MKIYALSVLSLCATTALAQNKTATKQQPKLKNPLDIFSCPGPYKGPYVDAYHYEWTTEPVAKPICPLRQTNPLHPEKQLLATWWRATCNTPCSSRNGTAAGDLLFMNYNLTLPSNPGAGVIDSTYDKQHPNGDPFNFTLGAKPRLQVVPGFDRALYGMCKGEKRMIKLTAAGGYGTNGAPPVIPKCAELYFSVELVNFSRGNTTAAGNSTAPRRLVKI